jgi:transcriptional regulator with XRE-family HTH domain
MSALPHAVHRAIVCVDVESFGDPRRTNVHRAAIRDGLYTSLCRAFDRSGVAWSGCDHEDRGDGVLILVPPEVPKSLLVSGVPRELAAALGEHNRAHHRQSQIRLRMAVHAGEILYDEHGVSGAALNVAFRLLEAAGVKHALARSAGALAVIISEWFHEEVVVHTPESDPASYRRVQVSVKETETTAWIRLPDDRYPLPQNTWLPRGRTSLLPSLAPGQLSATVEAVSGVGMGQTRTLLAYYSHPNSGQAGPVMARMLLGGRLRRLREAMGMTREDVGAAIGASESKICRMELGRTGSKQCDVADLLSLYGVTHEPERAELLHLAAQANARGWIHAYRDVLPGRTEGCLELEQAASLIRGYEPNSIPHLLQTADYARSVMWLGHCDVSLSYIERRVSLLMACQRVLHQMDPPKLWMIIDEAALHSGRAIGRATMRRQLQHLIEITDLSYVTIQVIPAGISMPVGGAITYLRFPEHGLAEMVLLDQLTNMVYVDRRADVDHYRQVMDWLGVRAAPPDATATILGRILKT